MRKGSKVKVPQLHLTLCNPMDCAVHGILQAWILEWVTVPFSRGFFQPRDWTQVPCIAGRFFTSWAPREAQWEYASNQLVFLLTSSSALSQHPTDRGSPAGFHIHSLAWYSSHHCGGPRAQHPFTLSYSTAPYGSPYQSLSLNHRSVYPMGLYGWITSLFCLKIFTSFSFCTGQVQIFSWDTNFPPSVFQCDVFINKLC